MRPQGSLVCLGEPNQYIRPQEVLNKIFEEQYGVPLDGLLSVKSNFSHYRKMEGTSNLRKNKKVEGNSNQNGRK